MWQKHNPPDDGVDDPFRTRLAWFSRQGRPVNELKEIASVAGTTITFTTPIHISYRTSHTAQLTRFTGVDNVQVQYAGLEDLKVVGRRRRQRALRVGGVLRGSRTSRTRCGW